MSGRWPRGVAREAPSAPRAVRPGPPPGEGGSLAVLTLAVAAVAMLLVYGVARVGGAAVLQARADSAADAAALAAADRLALGEGTGAAWRAAAETAAANGARLVACVCHGSVAEVAVALPAGGLPGAPAEIGGRARAVVDLTP